MEVIAFKSINKNIFKALLSLASAAFLVRIAGMLNQVIVSANFGGGAGMDAYFVASALPLLLAQLINDALEASVIPIYTRLRAGGDREQLSRFFNTLLNCCMLGALLFTLLMLAFRSPLLAFSAPALDTSVMAVAFDLAPFFFPCFLLLTVMGFLESILNAEGQFGWPAYAGILVPLATSVAILLVGSSFGLAVLGIGMLCGLALQFGIMVIRLRQAGIVYRPLLSLRTDEFRAVLNLAWPVLLAAVATQALPFFDQIVASFLVSGNISGLNYASKIISVPVGILFVSIGRAALPYFSHQYADNDMSAFKATLRLYVWGIALVTLLITLFLLLFAHPVVSLLFQRGAFSPADTDRTALALMGFTIGLVPLACNFLLTKALSALGRTRVLMGITLFSVLANTFLDILFASYWQIFGIALATSLVYACSLCLRVFFLRRAIGRLALFTFPPELLALLRIPAQGQLRTEKEGSLMHSRFSRLFTFQALLITDTMIVVLGGATSFFLDEPLLWQFALGLSLILLFLRYPYVLLLAWILVGPLIGSPIPLFNGNHFLTDLVVPAFLLLPFLPLRCIFQRLPALFPLAIFLLWMLTGFLSTPAGQGKFLVTWLSEVQYLTLAMLVIAVVTTRQRFLRIIDAILLFSLFVVGYGVYGYITRQNVQYDYFTTIIRIFSIFGSAPAVSTLLSIGIPLALYRAFTLQGFKRIFPLLVVGGLLVGVVLSNTRGAYIAIPLGLLVLFFAVPSRKLRFGLVSALLVLGIAVALLAVVGRVALFSRFFNENIMTLDGRTYLWQAVLSHFDPGQLFGRGLGASDILLRQLQVHDKYGLISLNAQSSFLATLYDQGMIGLVLLLLVWLTLLLCLVRGMQRATGERRLLFATTLAIYITVFLVAIQSNDPLNDLAIGSYFWMAMALPFAFYWRTSSVGVEDNHAYTTAPFENNEILDNQSLGNAENNASPVGKHLRVCLVSVGFPPVVGGTERQAQRHARQLFELGHEVLVVTFRHNRQWPRKETIQDVPVIRVGGLYTRNGRLRIGWAAHIVSDLALFLTLWRLRQRYDILHVFQTLFPAGVANVIGRLTRKPVIVRIQGTGPADDMRSRLAQNPCLMLDTLAPANEDSLKITFRDWAPGEGDISYLPRAGIGGQAVVNMLRKSKNTYFHVLSSRSCTYLHSHGIPLSRIVCIPNGVDAEQFQPDLHIPDLHGKERVIICVARQEYAKGVDVLLHAWGHLMRAKAEWGEDLIPVLQLVGDGGLRPQMELIAEKLGIQESVQFLGTRLDTIDLLHRSWAFVLPSRWEGMPNALLEAMACGLPCIAARVSGSEDIIVNGVNGLLVEPEEPLALATALRLLMTNSGLAQRLRQAGRTSVLWDYQLSFTVGQSVSLYRHLLAKAEKASLLAERKEG